MLERAKGRKRVIWIYLGLIRPLIKLCMDLVDLGLAFEELKGNSSPGHDGVPALLLKECRKELTHPLTSFRRASMDMGIIPEELQAFYVCFITHKEKTYHLLISLFLY